LFTPPFISFADPDGALMLLDEIMKVEVPKVIQTSTGPSMHTSPFRPENDRFWSICSEAGIKLCTHLATVTRYGAQGLDWSEDEVMLGDMDAFQWAFYYGDRPAMETVGAAILQGWFARFPKMQLLLSEQGTVWVPYTIRKLDHAFLMGRRATWGSLDRRPSEYFRDHCFVAPFPDPTHYGWPIDQATDFALAQLDYILQTLSSPADTAAFIVEPVLGEGGYVPANERFFAGLRQRADEHGILLAVDEVQTGFGRTGKFWGGEHFNARPDVLITAKGLASGFPLSAIAASSDLMAKAWPGSQGGTYGANAVACAAAVATYDVIRDEGLVDNSAQRGAQLKEALQLVADKHDQITDVRGLGLMIGNEFRDGDGKPDPATAAAVQQEAARRGLLLLTCGAWGQVVRFIPALVVTSDQVDEAASIWADAVGAVVAR